MLRSLWRWLFSGYTCDDCRKWTPRRRGRADVKIEQHTVPVNFDGTTTAQLRVMKLRCPACAGARKDASEGRGLLNKIREVNATKGEVPSDA